MKKYGIGPQWALGLALFAGSGFLSLTHAQALRATTSQTNVSCNGGSNGSATVTPSGGSAPYMYSWSNGATSATISGLTAQVYSVRVTDNVSATVDTAVSISQPPVLTASTTHTNVTTAGGSNGTATATAGGGTGGYTYSWAPTGGTAATASGLTAGTYTVTVTDANGCPTTATANITEAVPVPVVAKPVPTLSEWGVILMGLVLAGFAALRLRRAP